MAKHESKSVHIQIGDLESGENIQTASTAAAAAAGGVNTSRTNKVAPTEAKSTTTTTESPRKTPPYSRNLAAKLGKLLFLAHLLAIAVLISYLSLRGFLARNPAVHPARWHAPLIAATFSSAASSLAFLLLTLRHPSTALRASLWLSPLLTLLAAFLLLAAGNADALAFAAPALVLSLIQSLYACWITPRLPHAALLLSAALPSTAALLPYVAAAAAAGVVYSAIWALGVGGVATYVPPLAALYIAILLLSLAWAMHVIRNVVHVAAATVAYTKLVGGEDGDVREAFRGATTRCLGDVCVGSAVAPPVTAARGAARAVGLAAGEADEFLFSFGSCFMGVADRMVGGANRWGFVHVGVYGKGFVRASTDTWEMFEEGGLKEIIDADLTGSFCFLSGVVSGAVGALVAGSWVLAVDVEHVTGVAVYSFLIGYLLGRIAMAWPQACVSAFYVAYAENPQNQRLGSVIPDRIQELQVSPD